MLLPMPIDAGADIYFDGDTSGDTYMLIPELSTAFLLCTHVLLVLVLPENRSND